MSLGSNLQFYRKKNSLTQEGLADVMGVSRQTISKWESDQAFPETEKLITLSEKFGCTVDELIKGNAEDSFASDNAGYDKEMNRFTAAICAGTAVVMTGLSLMLLLNGLFADLSGKEGTQQLSTVFVGIFLLFVAIGAAIFIVGGIRHGQFVKDNPNIVPFYTDRQKKSFRNKFPVLIATATVLVLVGVVIVVILGGLGTPENMSEDNFGTLTALPLIVCVTVAAPIFIYAGMQYSKYDIESYNKENNPDKTPREKLPSAICGAIMLTAVIAFLLMGFLGELWHIGWVVFPVGGILCGIISMFFSTKEK